MRFFIVMMICIVAYNLDLKLPNPQWLTGILLFFYGFMAILQDFKEVLK